MVVTYWPLVAGALLGFATRGLGNRVICNPNPSSSMSFYDFNATNIYGNETIQFSMYQGSVLAIINLATY
ncbi:hypothetical protein DPMN_032321 [Dreissena polymorpha]|nr:hypothetical protein DPMN_032321 [Dreissena polymorpha]